ncbi:1-phosphatidylinositol 4,5-bisphosphate phosphodiesterase gamma-1-like isoform X3 [Stylophora pistillata]|uniref:1-phosphatidylinositol 4,5-bisphosphate phosphodiesterase gamma-1-like isoform X3 n=1 Tax=Stylophora pistillata TaxID=50429 RepID=UPI000C03E5D8|nr:1-phosphatidylinositol 4,5-bisphosphate phosphodiesterase gamma-1-like isoform X3 [Stylophora pistillata]
MSVENTYSPPPGLGEEMGPIIGALKEGSAMTRYYSKRQTPDLRIFMLKMEEFQVVWCRTGREGGRLEGSVFIREIKEVRRGLGSKDFDRNPELARRLDPNCCLAIFYGNEFKLKTLSLVAPSFKEREYWVRGLVYLMYESLIATQEVLIHRWLLREWNGMAALSSAPKRSSLEHPVSIGMKELRAFFQRANIKLNNARLKELIQIAGRGEGHIDFEGFRKIYNEIMTVKDLTKRFGDYIENGTYVPLANFQRFLLEEQEEPGAKDLETVRSYMLEYLADGSRSYSEPYFTVSEFLDYLMSKGNSAFNSSHCEVYQDMTKPLTSYWIASSHNTYLTGDQFQGEASVEAYIRALRMGCRCLELDCWDGPDGQPIITHGHTLVSRIKFVEVVRAIKDNAFVASDYPLILSLENHCSIPQQKVMAQTFKDLFGDCLLTQPVDPLEREMPSPASLKHKIILKHKKLPKDPNKVTETNVGDTTLEDDLSQSVKNGYLLLEDEIDHGWKKHFFCLTKNKLFWTEEQTKSEDDDDDEGADGNGVGEAIIWYHLSSKDELHFGERWFHGKLPDGRKAAENLLKQFNRGDGSFLVRESTTFVGDFSLSFWRKGRVQHCRIKSKQENGQTKYYLVDQVTFDSLYSLINFYQTHPLKSMNFELTLTDAIPQPNAHLEKDWYHDNLKRDKAEDMLKRVRRNGAFLVRKKESDNPAAEQEQAENNPESQNDESSFAISFRAEGKIKHCRIKREGRLYTIGTAQFESLVELVEFYMKHPLYKGMKLKYQINEEVLSKVGQSPDEDAIYGTGDHYHEPNQFITKAACRALWDYEAQNPDEMSFCRGAFITNVSKEDGGWWIGDYGGQKQKFFPANYCEEINYVAEDEQNINPQNDNTENHEMSPLGDLQKGSIDLQGCIVENIASKPGQRHVFQIAKRDGQILLEPAAESQEDLADWLQALQQMADKREAMVQKMVRQSNLSQELSDLVVYCQSVQFDIGNVSGKHYEMSSFPETRLERFFGKRLSREFIKYHRKQFSRVYPRGSRIDSSNYDPVMMWNHGVQLCALNYQTPDRAMQLNHGKFLDNGRCGYVLHPECIRSDTFDLYNRDASGAEPLTLTLTIIGARHLVKSGRGIASPFVEVEIVGAPYDNTKFKTETKPDNGLNPVWWVKFDVDVINPPLAYLRFVVFDEDMFGEPNFIGHAIFPMCSLKTGYRSVPLKNAYSEECELSCLLVHIDIRSAMGGDENLYASIQVLRDRVEEISNTMENEELRARATIASLLTQQNGPMSLEAQQRIQNDHQHQMENLGKQLRQQQDDLRRLQKERAARTPGRVMLSKPNRYTRNSSS